jgi:hypothetical protein
MTGTFIPYFDWSKITFNYLDQLKLLFGTLDLVQGLVSQSLKFMYEKISSG